MVPTYSLMGPFRGHMSLKSSPFSPGPSCKLSNQYIIQDHMAAHFKKLMSTKAAVDSSAPKSLHTSVKWLEDGEINKSLSRHVSKPRCAARPFRQSHLAVAQQNPTVSETRHLLDKDQQKRDRLIQTLEKYKRDLVRSLPATPFNSRSVSPSQQKMRWSLLENGHPYLTSGWNNSSGTKREQPPSVSFQKFTSRTLMPAPAARRSIPNGAPCALSQSPVHNSSTGRSSASLLLRARMHLGSHNTKKAFQNSVHKTYSGDLLDRHSAYFTEKKQCFSPRILKTSHQSFLMKYRYYNPPSRKRSSSPSRPPFKSSDISNEKKSELHRFLEDSHVRPHSVHFSQQPVENRELWIQNSEMPLFPGLQFEEKEEEYLRFLQDLTNDILIRSCYHREALEDVFQMHIKSKRHNLDEVKMTRIVQGLKKELNITNRPHLSISCEGTWQKDADIPATCF